MILKAWHFSLWFKAKDVIILLTILSSPIPDLSFQRPHLTLYSQQSRSFLSLAPLPALMYVCVASISLCKVHYSEVIVQVCYPFVTIAAVKLVMTSRAAASVPQGSCSNGQWRHFFHEVIFRGSDAADPDGFSPAHGLMMDGFSQRLCRNIFPQTLLEYIYFGTLLTGKMVLLLEQFTQFTL